jgi:hypothetical protein
MLLLVLWCSLIILAFALIYGGLAPRIVSASESASVGFGTLLYMSGSTFLTLGLGDVTAADPITRLFILLEAGTGYIFLALIITYMPVLEQAYEEREVGNMLIRARTSRPRSAIKLLHRSCGTDPSELLRGDLREAERWMAEILQSHLAHPVLTFYRGHHWGQSWLVSLTTVLDTCSILIASSDGLLKAQARITFRMGLRLLKDLTDALSLRVDPACRLRLTEGDLAALLDNLKSSGLNLSVGPSASRALTRLVGRYDRRLLALAAWLVIPLPTWKESQEAPRETCSVDPKI